MKGFIKPPWPKGLLVDDSTEHSDPHSLPTQNALALGPLLEVANRLWRIKTTVDIHGEENLKEFNLIRRNVESALDAFNEAGFNILDHTGEKVPEGGHLSWKVLTYQENDSISFDIVVETVKPTIYVGNIQVQRGEVVIATPVNKGPVANNSSTEVKD